MNATTKISYNKEYAEYRVRLYIDNVYQRDADYFTNCKTDAKMTALHMQSQAVKSN
jgi:hypothetical protein